MKNIATLFINEVFDNAYVHTNVNNKNINVEFPKLDEKTLEKEKFSKKPNENMQKRLGQSIPIVSHKIKEPKKINITPIASLVKPFIGGINLPSIHIAMQIGMIIDLYILLSFNFIMFYCFFFLIYHFSLSLNQF